MTADEMTDPASRLDPFADAGKGYLFGPDPSTVHLWAPNPTVTTHPVHACECHWSPSLWADGEFECWCPCHLAHACRCRLHQPAGIWLPEGAENAGEGALGASNRPAESSL